MRGLSPRLCYAASGDSRTDAVMSWIIGIDEAGYGPNLGPLVMTAVACRVPDDLGCPNLWQLLGRVVRQAADDAEEGDGRVLVDDSKLLYSTTRGLAELERGVHA